MGQQIRRVAFAAYVLLLALGLAACDGEPAPEPHTVAVVYGETTVTVDLGDLDVVTFQDAPHVRLSDVVEAASLGVALESLELDFEAADGFRSSSSSNCDDFVPVPGALLAQGYVNLETRRTAWEEALDFPGCLRVADLARILASDVE